MLKNDLLKYFEANPGVETSGEALASRFGVSRTAVWKVVHALEEEGYRFQKGREYLFLPDNDILSKEGIEARSGDLPGLAVFPMVSSTNALAKGLAAQGAKEGIIVAGSQSAGRGRLGRSFYSPEGSGVYLSFFFPATEEGAFVTIRTVVATVRALESLMHERLAIKWVNDVFYKGKKVVGILCEETSDLESGEMHTIIAGIGVNVHATVFPAELQDVAGSLGLSASRNDVASAIITSMKEVLGSWSKDEVLAFYRERMMLIDEDVSFRREDLMMHGLVRGVSSDGGLIVETEDGTKVLKSGEVSLSSRAVARHDAKGERS